ncbi:MAG: DUF3348 domain-containing protein [Pusillimonas sp.]
MVQELSRRTSFSGPALVRLLARLNDADIFEPRQTLSDRLSQWLGWADAISLAGALNGAAPALPAGSGAPGLDEENEYARVRAALSNAIAGINTPAAPRHRGRQRPAAVQEDAAQGAAVEFSTYRQRYASLQQDMETRITDLRMHLRAGLVGRSPAMASLAAVDAAMEQALKEREYRLLAGVPGMLEAHFERLRQSGPVAPADDGAGRQSPVARPGAWLDIFHKDMQRVLLAELDIRLQPIEGLLCALRAH